MITTHTFDRKTWVDIDHGTEEEVKPLIERYGLHPFIAENLIGTTPRPRFELHDRHMYVVLHFPVWKHSHAHSEKTRQEIDFVIGSDHFITAHYDTIDALHKFTKDMEVKEVLSKNSRSSSPQGMFVTVLRELYNSLFEELAHIEDLTEGITARIFSGKEREMVVSISHMSRVLLDFKRTTDLHREVLESVHHHGSVRFGKEFSQAMESIIADYLKMHTVIKSNLETLHELRDTNDSLLTAKQNETVKQLTAMGFIILPLNLIAVIFAMRTEGMPLIGNPNGFWMVIILMLLSIALTVVYARHRKWM